MKMPEMTPSLQLLGCGNVLCFFGSIISGFYQGALDAKGISIDSNLKNFIRYGPIGLSGFLGLITASEVSKDRSVLEEMIRTCPSNLDEQQAEGCFKGCGSVIAPVIGMAFTSVAEYIGYTAGNLITKTVSE